MEKYNFALTIASNALNCPNPSEWYSKAYITQEIVDNFRVIPGVKNSTKVSNATFVSVLKAEDCDFTASSSALSAVTMSVVPVQAQVSICKSDIQSSYVSQSMAKGALNWNVTDFMNNYWSALSSEIQEEIATIMWVGDTSNTAYTGTNAYKKLANGFNVLLNADAAVVDITLTASTTATVLNTLMTALNALPVAAKSKKKDLRFYVASDVYNNFLYAAAAGNTGAFITEQQKAKFLGIEVLEQPTMTNGNIVITRKDNLVYLLDGENDADNLVAVDTTNTMAIASLRTAVWLSIGFGILNPSEIVFVH